MPIIPTIGRKANIVGSGISGHPQLCNDSEANLGYMSPPPPFPTNHELSQEMGSWWSSWPFSSLRNRVEPAVDEEPLVTVTECHTECSALCIQLLNLLDLAYETAGHAVGSHMACIPAVSLELHPGPHLPWAALGSSL